MCKLYDPTRQRHIGWETHAFLWPRRPQLLHCFGFGQDDEKCPVPPQLWHDITHCSKPLSIILDLEDPSCQDFSAVCGVEVAAVNPGEF